jgi:peptide/nickel transport system permease protein
MHPEETKKKTLKEHLKYRYHSRKKKLLFTLKGFHANWLIFKKNKMGLFGLGLLICFGLMALASFILPLIDPMYHPMTGVDPMIFSSKGPSLTHWLGTDSLGRDILSQLLVGARVAFMIGVSAAFMTVTIGTTVGLLAGYFGKTVDFLLMRFADIILVLPDLLVIIILAAVIGGGKLSIWNIVIVISLLGWAGTARVVRSQTLSLKQRPYVDAAKISGSSEFGIIHRHIVPNIIPLSLLYMTFRVTSAILVEAALSFLGFGDTSTVSWGMMLQWCWKTGHMFKAPYWLLPPGISISLITLSFYLIGRAMEEIVNPRLRER